MNEALVVLVLIWAGLLIPGARRSRDASPHATVGGFEHAMDVLRSDIRGTSGSRRVLVPGHASRIMDRPGLVGGPEGLHRLRGPDPVIARRLVWFRRLLVAFGVTLLVALVVGGWFWLPFVISVVLTGVYVAVLRHLKLQRDEARRVVSELDITIDLAAAERDVAVGDEDWVGSGSVRLRRWND